MHRRILAAASTASLGAQEARWKELTARVVELNRQGNYVEGLAVAEEALRVAVKTFSPGDLRCASSLNDLGMLAYALGRLGMQRRTIGGRLNPGEGSRTGASGGCDDLEQCRGNVRLQGKYLAAQPLHERALSIREKSLPPGDPAIGISLNNLALVLVALKNPAAAEPLYRRALGILEKTSPQDSATVLNNVGDLDFSQGKHADAERSYQRALTIQQKTLGPAHPSVALTLQKLGMSRGSRTRERKRSHATGGLSPCGRRQAIRTRLTSRTP